MDEEYEKEATEDFFMAKEFAGELLEDFSEVGMQMGPAICGALTEILIFLFRHSPDTATATTILQTGLDNATSNIENTLSGHFSSLTVH